MCQLFSHVPTEQFCSCLYPSWSQKGFVWHFEGLENIYTHQENSKPSCK